MVFIYIDIVDGTLLALAGLRRLGMDTVLEESEVLSWEDMLPAVAQGAIGIQCRSDDSRVLSFLEVLNHPETKAAVDCERAFLRRLDGNCRTPIAGQARILNGRMEFQGIISKPNGSDMIRITRHCAVTDDAELLGDEAGLEVRRIAGDSFEEYGKAVLAHQDAAAIAN